MSYPQFAQDLKEPEEKNVPLLHIILESAQIVSSNAQNFVRSPSYTASPAIQPYSSHAKKKKKRRGKIEKKGKKGSNPLNQRALLCPLTASPNLSMDASPKLALGAHPPDVKLEAITFENKEYLKKILQKLTRRLAGSLLRDVCCNSLCDMLAGVNGKLFLQSIRRPKFKVEVYSLLDCVANGDPDLPDRPLPECYQTAAVNLVKILLARPGRIPTDADALLIIEELKTTDAKAFLEEFMESFYDPTRKISIDMILVASEFLNASLYELDNDDSDPWTYSRGLIQSLVKAFASEIGFEVFENLFAEVSRPISEDFVQHYLQCDVLSKITLSGIFSSTVSSNYSLDATFTALWTFPGLCFVTMAQDYLDVPKRWQNFVGFIRL